MFADFTYEGARSIDGAFLGSLGASAVAVGIIAGLGEFVGYGLRLVGAYVFGRLLDRAGTPVLIIVFLLSALFAPFVFLGTAFWALIGMIL